MEERQRIFYINHEEARLIALLRTYRDAEGRFILESEVVSNDDYEAKRSVLDGLNKKAKPLEKNFLAWEQTEMINALIHDVQRLTGQQWPNGEPFKIGYRAEIPAGDFLRAIQEERDRIAAEALKVPTLEDRMKEFAREVAALEEAYGFEICSEGNEKTVIIFDDAAYDWPDIN